jgi:hypothetical protein
MVIKVISFIETITPGWENISGYAAVLMLPIFCLKFKGLSNTTINQRD